MGAGDSQKNHSLPGNGKLIRSRQRRRGVVKEWKSDTTFAFCVQETLFGGFGQWSRAEHREWSTSRCYMVEETMLSKWG